MTSASPLAPVPHRMDVEVLHDGVRWNVRENRGTMVVFVMLALAPTLGALFAAITSQSWAIAALGMVIGGLFGMAATRVPLAAELRLTERHVTIERRRMFEQQRTSLRLDELDVVDLADPPELGGSGQMVLRAGHDTIVFGRDLPRDHNAWFVAAVESARDAVARREHREGREYTFLRKPPEAVAALRDPSEPTDG